MCRVPEMTNVDEPDEDTYDGYNLRKHVAKIVEFVFQGCLLANLRSDGLVDIANCRTLTGENDDGLRTTVNDSGALHMPMRFLLIEKRLCSQKKACWSYPVSRPSRQG